MLRQIARHDQITLEAYRRDLERLAQLSIEEEENLRSMRSRRDALLQARRAYVAARWKSRVVKRASKSIVDKKNTRWPIPIEGRTLNLRYLGKSFSTGFIFSCSFWIPSRALVLGLSFLQARFVGSGRP